MAKKDTAPQAEVTARAMEADPFEQPYWNLDQYLIWLASRDPAAVLKATARRPNVGTTPPLAWCAYEGSNVDREKVEMEAIRAIKGGRIKARVEFNGEWITPDDPEWFEELIIESGGEPTLGALLVRTTKHGRREKLRPQFNPQSIRRLYRAPTSSNIRDRPDVENTKAGVFISYHDVLNWLAERISLEESIPIDEAGSLAEEKIRYTCMSAPEKLTMWGFRQGDPAAELKAVSPQAWQALWINPVAGQPEADLKALGYSREYGAATKGEYGSVIWTGLCFDRKQLVAAFVTDSDSGPPNHAPAARPSQPRSRTPRRRPSRERAESAINELYPHGIPDDRSDAELVSAVEAKIRERKQKAVSADTILRAAGRRK